MLKLLTNTYNFKIQIKNITHLFTLHISTECDATQNTRIYNHLILFTWSKEAQLSQRGRAMLRVCQ